MAKKKVQKGQNEKQVEEKPEPLEEKNKSQKKGQNKKGGQKQAQNKKEELRVKEESLEESEEEAIPQPVKRGKKNQKQAQSKKQVKEESLEESEPEEEAIPQPVKRGKKNQKPQSKKQVKEESLEESESEEEAIPQPVKRGKKNQKQAQSKKQVKEESLEESESEEEAIPQPVKRGKKNQKQPQSKKQVKEESLEESESEEEAIPQPVKRGKKNQKQAQSKKQVKEESLEESEEEAEESLEESEEEAIPQPVKQGNKKDEKKKQEEAEETTEKGPKKPLTKLEKTKLRQEKKSGKVDQDAILKKKEEAKDLLEKEGKGSDSMSNDIHVENINISYPKKDLLRNAQLHLAHGRKYGLVAPNGAGKSTVLNWLATRRDVFNSVPSHFDILHVEQEVAGGDESALESVIAADTERTRLLEEEIKLSKFCDQDEDDNNVDPDEIEKASARLSQVYDRLDQIEAYSAEARASQILSGLQFDEQMKVKKTRDFSGGWRMRIALARALFRKPTLLLLDEPTNHLDLFAVIWLETYLKGWKNTLLVVSHDQDFLNNVCTDIIHIHDCKLNLYKGMTYDGFKRSFENAQDQLKKDYEKQQKLLKQQQLAKQKKKDSVSNAQKKRLEAKVVRNKDKNKPNKTKDEDENDQKRLIEKPRDYLVHFDFPEPPPLTLPVLDAHDVSFGYKPEQILFKKLSFGIDMDSKIALVGPNGTGKSTLLKLLMEKMPPTTGTITSNRKLRIGHFAQHFVDQLTMDETPVKYIMTQHNVEEKDARALLGRFGLAGHTHLRPISSLSGGQKSRVVLSKLSFQKPNILFLDEPTNHLDMESIEALAQGLNKFEGGIVLVSHDSRLISEVCHDIWAIDPDDRSVHPFDGDFHEYRAMLVENFEKRLREEEEKRMQDEETKKDSRKKERDEKLRKLEEIKNKGKKVILTKKQIKATEKGSSKGKKKN